MKILDIWYGKIKNDFLNNKKNIIIPDFINIEELFEKLQKDKTLNLTNEDILNKNYYYKIIKGNHLTNDQIEKIQDEHLEFYIINKKETTKISERIYFKKYTKSFLENKKYLTIQVPLNNYDIECFEYINENATIYISHPNDLMHESTYFKHIKNIINKISNHNRNYQIAITVLNRKLLEYSMLLENIPNNINLHISCNQATYTKEEFLEEEKLLNILIDPIKDSNLSPLEKYIAVYNIVKKYKEYKENNKNLAQARILKHIVHNEYIVCGGFSTLLHVLLQKVNISSSVLSMEVEDKNDEKNHSGHIRNIVKIDDDKYNIHGIYLADSTWDNDLQDDLYLNILLTHDEKKEAKYNEYLEVEDMLFDFHDFFEYNIKMNTLLYKTSKNVPNKSEQIRYMEAYISTYEHILGHLKYLDYEKYIYFRNKYQKNIYNTSNIKRQENYVFSFFTEYGLYIIPLSNNKIKKETIMNAALITKIDIEKMTDEELEKWKKDVLEINNECFISSFPYIYNYQSEIYLEQRKK